jgi:hypothetical protein
LETRGLKVMSYDQYKDITNLSFLKYGTRLVKKITGSFGNGGDCDISMAISSVVEYMILRG